MSEFQLTIPYKTQVARLALASTYLLLPVWSLLLPITLGLFLGWLIRNPTGVNLSAMAVVCVSLFLLAALGMVWSALAEDNKIHLSKNGVSFPPFLLPALRFRRNFLWAELIGATLVDSDRSKQLLLNFGDGISLKLNSASIKSTDLEEMLLAIELWANKCEREPVLIEFQRGLQNQNKGLNEHSYTQMWEEELSRRFRSTTFIPLEPGHALQRGKLKVVRQIAFGGLSAIYQVQKEDAEIFVLKEAVVPPNADEATRKAAEHHLMRESQMLFCLYHPKIARVLDLFVEDERHYLLMEYVHGQDLRQFVKQNGAVSAERAIQWAGEICEILEFLHKQEPPIIHRDLTPDNLVLNKDETVTLIDFGAANEFVGTATGTLVGKQAYIAPEQLRGKAAPQSDFYAFGGTLFFLLTGRDPIPLMQTDLKAVVPESSEQLSDFVKQLTAYDRKARFKNTEEIKAFIEQLKASQAAAQESEPQDAVRF
jgi:Serine/threonine protein kinase